MILAFHTMSVKVLSNIADFIQTEVMSRFCSCKPACLNVVLVRMGSCPCNQQNVNAADMVNSVAFVSCQYRNLEFG